MKLVFCNCGSNIYEKKLSTFLLRYSLVNNYFPYFLELPKVFFVIFTFYFHGAYRSRYNIKVDAVGSLNGNSLRNLF